MKAALTSGSLSAAGDLLAQLLSWKLAEVSDPLGFCSYLFALRVPLLGNCQACLVFVI
jgi:hypothetical protein